MAEFDHKKDYHDNGLDDYDDHKNDYDHNYKSCKIVEGTKKDDYLHGSDKNEIFLAGKGNDHVYGDGGKAMATVARLLRPGGQGLPVRRQG